MKVEGNIEIIAKSCTGLIIDIELVRRIKLEQASAASATRTAEQAVQALVLCQLLLSCIEWNGCQKILFEMLLLKCNTFYFATTPGYHLKQELQIRMYKF